MEETDFYEKYLNGELEKLGCKSVTIYIPTKFNERTKQWEIMKSKFFNDFNIRSDR